jgi:hypothetical protein
LISFASQLLYVQLNEADNVALISMKRKLIFYDSRSEFSSARPDALSHLFVRHVAVRL